MCKCITAEEVKARAEGPSTYGSHVKLGCGQDLGHLEAPGQLQVDTLCD